ncbi:hypothetical protein A1359_03505 [Methylomonas lenta]|uniref:PEP-CTERM protein-sorting domain-containing protein n=1 Tax=Methylomonas lenta TaxID=980561 RepID=A0A177NS92_9GAMM|nr:hypothetical protein [Methylomonas lenta]OAI20089.1 hypothetical protein A1359_03505 [Methylomonas lenta]
MTNIKLITGSIAALSLLANCALAETVYEPAEYQPRNSYTASEFKITPANRPHNSPAAPAVAITQVEPSSPQIRPSATGDEGKSSRSDIAAGTMAQQPELATGKASAAVGASSNSPSNDLLYPGIVLLGVLMFWLVSKKRLRNTSLFTAGKPATSESCTTVLTGVERYLQRYNSKKTGVEKYLEKHTKATKPTGVAKYLAKQVVRDKTTA